MYVFLYDFQSAFDQQNQLFYGFSKTLIRISFFSRIICTTSASSDRGLTWVMRGFTFSLPSAM